MKALKGKTKLKAACKLHKNSIIIVEKWTNDIIGIYPLNHDMTNLDMNRYMYYCTGKWGTNESN